MAHKFKVGDRVIYTNDFGVCWGVKTITECTSRPWTREDYPQRPTYHYEGSDTPWFSVDENNFKLATEHDLMMADWWFGAEDYFQTTHGFIPTVGQLGGCY